MSTAYRTLAELAEPGFEVEARAFEAIEDDSPVPSDLTVEGPPAASCVDAPSGDSRAGEHDPSAMLVVSAAFTALMAFSYGIAWVVEAWWR